MAGSIHARRVAKREAAKAQAKAKAEAWAKALQACTHDGHWLEVEPGRMVRCPCWRRAKREANGEVDTWA